MCVGVCVCVCVCERVRACVYALRIVSTDKIEFVLYKNKNKNDCDLWADSVTLPLTVNETLKRLCRCPS